MRFNHPPIVACAAAALAAVTIAPQLAAAATFQGLGHVRGYDWTEAQDVSDDGAVVVGWSQSSQSYNTSGEPFRWTRADGMQRLGFLPGAELTLDSAAYGVNGDGSAIVGISGNRAFLWTSADGMQELLDGGAYAISSDGSAIGGSFGAFRRTSDDEMEFLRGLGGASVNSVSADGSVVVGDYCCPTGGIRAFRWNSASGRRQDLGTLPGADGDYGTFALDVSAEGSVVVGWSGPEAFRWTSAGGMEGLGHLSVSGRPGSVARSAAFGVSGDGSLIVGSSSRSFSFYAPDATAFIWDAVNGMRDLKHVLVSDYGLNLTGWHLSQGNAISADGRTIVGTGTNPLGYTEAWIATIPEPSSLMLLGLGSAFLLLLRRRQPSREGGSETVN